MKSLRFFKGLSWLILLNLLIKPVWIFAIDRQVQNIVGFSQYGRYFSILNLSIVLSFIADAGLTNMVNRQLAVNEVINIKQLFFLKLLLLIVYCSSVLLVAKVAGITNRTILLPVIYIQAITSLFLFLRGLITAHQLFKTDAWLSVIDKTLMIIICGAFIFFPFLSGSINLPLFLYAQVGCTTVAIGIAAFIIYKKDFVTSNSPPLNIRKIAASTFPFAAIILLMSAHNRLDAFLLERMHSKGAYEAGVYASAYRLLDAGNMMGYLVASFLVPYVGRNSNNISLINETVTLLKRILLITGISAAMVIIIWASQFLQLLYHTTNAYNVYILQLTIAVLPAYYLMHLYGSVLTAAGKLNALISILTGCVLLNVIINIIFIPFYGALACGIAAITSQYTCALLVYFRASKKS